MLGGWVNPHREQHELPALTALAQHIPHSHSGIDEKRPTEKCVLPSAYSTYRRNSAETERVAGRPGCWECSTGGGSAAAARMRPRASWSNLQRRGGPARTLQVFLSPLGLYKILVCLFRDCALVKLFLACNTFIAPPPRFRFAINIAQ